MRECVLDSTNKEEKFITSDIVRLILIATLFDLLLLELFIKLGSTALRIISKMTTTKTGVTYPKICNFIPLFNLVDKSADASYNMHVKLIKHTGRRL
jgi:hypothetical protein